jgi:hypothetical protein
MAPRGKCLRRRRLVILHRCVLCLVSCVLCLSVSVSVSVSASVFVCICMYVCVYRSYSTTGHGRAPAADVGARR